VVGAPFLDPVPIITALNSLSLPGVQFDTTTFVPTASKFKGKRCRVIVIAVTDPRTFQPLRAGLHLLREVLRRTPGATLQRRWFVRLMGSARVFEEFTAGTEVDEIISGWGGGLRDFERKRRGCLMYE
jgi:uncharacterized protein YbbC (DUF1343 family)